MSTQRVCDSILQIVLIDRDGHHDMSVQIITDRSGSIFILWQINEEIQTGMLI